ncbi:MAG: DNA repair protein RadA [Pseudomonadota bacterium]
MAKPRTRYRCTSCEAEHASWFGQCPTCRAWNSLELVQIAASSTAAARRSAEPVRPLPISQVALGDGGEVRLSTGIGELDRVLGGGLVAGSLTLIGGDPGVGKSTLLLTALARLARRGLPVLYVSGEESARQVRLRADRLGVGGDSLYLLAETDLDRVDEAVQQVQPRFLVIDSIQVMRDPGVESLPGTVPQIRAVADRAMSLAKGRGVATMLVGHVTREGTIAGPRLLEHLVDTVIYFECDGHSPLRVLRAVKNRFGATGELGLFEMGEVGLQEVPDASARLLAERDVTAPGTAVVVAMEGSRPLLCEVQALVGSPGMGTPARHALGVERARVLMLLAVLEKAGLSVAERDVYVSAAGGVQLFEPATDLAVLAAVASSLKGRPVPRELAFFGEVGLTGEVRSVTYPALRLTELSRNGFTRAVVPAAAAKEAPTGVRLHPARSVRDVLKLVLG